MENYDVSIFDMGNNFFLGFLILCIWSCSTHKTDSSSNQNLGCKIYDSKNEKVIKKCIDAHIKDLWAATERINSNRILNSVTNQSSKGLYDAFHDIINVLYWAEKADNQEILGDIVGLVELSYQKIQKKERIHVNMGGFFEAIDITEFPQLWVSKVKKRKRFFL